MVRVAGAPFRASRFNGSQWDMDEETMDEQQTETPIHCPLEPTYPYNTAPLVPCDPTEVEPLLAHLHADAPVDDAGGERAFPRGTVTADGRLDLCKQSLGPENCRRVTEALAHNTRVASLLLGTDGIGDEGAADVARLLGTNDRLEIVYLGCNKIGPAGTREIARALEGNASVSGLWLKRNPIGEEGAKALADMLRRNTTLRALDLVNTLPGTAGLNAVIDVLTLHNRTVERLYVGGNDLGQDAAERLAELLRANPRVTSLLVSVNRVGDGGAKTLAAALGENTTLRELGLGSNGIGPDGAAALFDAAASHPALSFLDLGHARSTRALAAPVNEISDEGAKAAGRMLSADPPALHRLDLRGPQNIGESGREALAVGLAANTRLLALALWGRPHPGIESALARNRAAAPPEALAAESHAPRDVALIKSVYRTA